MTILELLRLAQAAEERGDKAGARRLYEQAGQQTRIQAEIERLMRRARRSMALSFVMMVVSVVLIVISVWQWMRSGCDQRKHHEACGGRRRQDRARCTGGEMSDVQQQIIHYHEESIRNKNAELAKLRAEIERLKARNRELQLILTNHRLRGCNRLAGKCTTHLSSLGAGNERASSWK